MNQQEFQQIWHRKLYHKGKLLESGEVHTYFKDILSPLIEKSSKLWAEDHVGNPVLTVPYLEVSNEPHERFPFEISFLKQLNPDAQMLKDYLALSLGLGSIDFPLHYENKNTIFGTANSTAMLFFNRLSIKGVDRLAYTSQLHYYYPERITLPIFATTIAYFSQYEPGPSPTTAQEIEECRYLSLQFERKREELIPDSWINRNIQIDIPRNNRWEINFRKDIQTGTLRNFDTVYDSTLAFSLPIL